MSHQHAWQYQYVRGGAAFVEYRRQVWVASRRCDGCGSREVLAPEEFSFDSKGAVWVAEEMSTTRGRAKAAKTRGGTKGPVSPADSLSDPVWKNAIASRVVSRKELTEARKKLDEMLDREVGA